MDPDPEEETSRLLELDTSTLSINSRQDPEGVAETTFFDSPKTRDIRDDAPAKIIDKKSKTEQPINGKRELLSYILSSYGHTAEIIAASYKTISELSGFEAYLSRKRLKEIVQHVISCNKLSLPNQSYKRVKSQQLSLIEALLQQQSRSQITIGEQCTLIDDLLQENNKRRIENERLQRQLQQRGRHVDVEPDGHRWYWVNKRERTWEEFDPLSNGKLERSLHKGKELAHVQVDGKWQHVTFATMKMKKTNFPDETAVKRSDSKPVYKESAKKEDQRPRKIREHRSEPDGSDADDGNCHEEMPEAAAEKYFSEDEMRTQKGGRKVKREEEIEEQLSWTMGKQRIDRGKEEKTIGEYRSEPDGSDVDNGQNEEPGSLARKQMITYPNRRMATDMNCLNGGQEAEVFPSDDDIKKRKYGKREKKTVDDTRKSQSGGQRKDHGGDKRLEGAYCSSDDESDEDHKNPSAQSRRHTKSHGHTLQIGGNTAEFFSSDDDMKKRKRDKGKKKAGDNTSKPQIGRKRKDHEGDKRIGGAYISSDDEFDDEHKNARSHRRRYANGLGYSSQILDNAEAEFMPSDDDLKKQKRGSKRKEKVGDETRKPQSGGGQLKDHGGDKRIGNHQADESSSTEERKYLLNEDSAVHFEAHHGGFNFLHTYAQSNRDKIRPLHIAASLGLKRQVSYLLQAGWDVDEKDQNGASAVQVAQSEALAEYIKQFDFLEATNSMDMQPQAANTHEECKVLPVTMERVDLSTIQVYLPSFQFRKTFQNGKHTSLLFTSPYITTYQVVCQHQMYGLLWLLGHCGRNLLTCLNNICLPDWDIQYFRDANTGDIDVEAWLRSKEPRQHPHHSNQQRHPETRTIPNWIQSIIEGDTETFKEELQRGIEHPDDGWTPLHFAILMQQHDMVRYLLENQICCPETRSDVLLPRIVLEELKNRCQFEYSYVYRHSTGFTPLLLATFLGNKVAIDILGKHMSAFQQDMEDCLTLAYCNDTEEKLLNIVCNSAEKYVYEKYSVNVKLHSVYEKNYPNKRIFIGTSNKIHRRIEENVAPVRLILDNKNIIREFLKPCKTVTSEKDINLLVRVIESHADHLWRRHSNLNAIVPGHTSSLLEEQQTDNVMVVLHCSHKGFIHTNELPFRKYLQIDGKHVRVHIIQGTFRFGPKTGRGSSVYSSARALCKLQAGYEIFYVPGQLRATLGMMVEDLDGNTGILTCAHTFIDDFLKQNGGQAYDKLYEEDRPLRVDIYPHKAELLVSGDHQDMDVDEPEQSRSVCAAPQATTEEESPDSSDSDCKMENADRVIRCGYVRRVIFKTGMNVATAIDVALIMLTNDSVKCCPKLYFFERNEQDGKEQLKPLGQGFKRKHLKFDTGRIFKLPDKKVQLGYDLVKCGLKTGLTAGKLAFSDTSPGAQVKVSGGDCKMTMSYHDFIIKGQMLVNRTSKVFFEQGDSGSAVFVKTDVGFQCLGLAIGEITSSCETLVTPIECVLDALKEQPQGASRMQEYKLKTFS